MKRITSILALALVLTTLLTACSAAANTSELTEATQMKNIYQKEDPALDDTLNLLMIGNSGCFYFVEELYGLAEAAGIKMRVCNVYYSGCNLVQHWTWWKNGEAHYEYYTTDENGRVKTAEGCTLEYCLQQQNWDYISLQEGSTGVLRDVPVDTYLGERKQYLDDLFGYLKAQFPMSKLYWQQNSAYQVGYSGSYAVNSLEDQIQDTKNYREVAIKVSEQYNLDWIPRGEASLIMRQGGYDNLCARLGKGEPLHSGDNYHDGDIGGGQYLTACVWLEMLTGESCIGNSYRPVYTYQTQTFELEEDFVVKLQEAAHQAVAAVREGE